MANPSLRIAVSTLKSYNTFMPFKVTSTVVKTSHPLCLRTLFNRTAPLPAKEAGNAARYAHASLPQQTLDTVIADGTRFRTLYTIDEAASVFDATKLMSTHNIGAVILTRNVDGSKKPVGILTERDYLRKIVHEGRQSKETQAKEIAVMEKDLIVINPDDTVQYGIDVMASKDIRHLPIVREDGSLYGMVSLRDLLGEARCDYSPRIRHMITFVLDS